MDEIAFIVVGGLNTDIVANGIREFPEPGGYVIGKELIIGPGGKSRNIAAMIGLLAPEKTVAMVSRTSRDDFGLWKVPLDALHNAGVNTDFVRILPFSETNKMPAIALIPINESGQNQIYVLPGIAVDFGVADIDAADGLFRTASKNEGFLVLTLECPVQTMVHAAKKATARGIRVLFDPGGIESASQAEELLKVGAYLIKPNEHEAQLITGVQVTDFASARQAADKFRQLGAQNVLITHGEHGAYLFSDAGEAQLLVQDVITDSTVKDATGCGDQTLATLCACLQAGKSLETSTKIAVAAGTLQFHKSGIQPITKAELEANGYSI